MPDRQPAAAPTQARTLLVIPVYNHAKTVRAVAEKALGAGFPVLVIDDGSTDGSLAAVDGLPIARHRFPANRGKGAAIRAGAEIARQSGYDAILTVDADGQHDPADGRLLLEAAASAWPAIVVGARRMETSRAPGSSVFGRDFSNFWVRLECGRSLPDTQSGCRLYPVDLLSAIPFLSAGYPFEVEVLVRAAWAGYPLLSTPVSVHYPPDDERVSHFHLLWDNLRLSCLHACLVVRSLLPWPHRRPARGEDADRQAPSIFHPVRFIRHLSREASGAGELAAAVFVGIFIGALPIIPFGLAAIVYVTHRLRLNKLAGAAASNVCVAPFVPLLCMEAGHFMTHGRFLHALDRQTLLAQVHYRLWEWLLGALVLGPLLGLAGALLTYVAVRSVRGSRAAHRLGGAS